MAKKKTKKSPDPRDDVDEVKTGPFGLGGALCRSVDWRSVFAAVTAQARRAISAAQAGGKTIDVNSVWARAGIADPRSVPGSKPGDIVVVFEARPEPGPSRDARIFELEDKLSRAEAAKKLAEDGLKAARTESAGASAALDALRSENERLAAHVADVETELRLYREVAS